MFYRAYKFIYYLSSPCRRYSHSGACNIDRSLFHKYLRGLVEEYNKVMEAPDMTSPRYKDNGPRLAYLKPITNIASQISVLSQEIQDIDQMLTGLSKEDGEMHSLGEQERQLCLERMTLLEEQAECLVVQVDAADNNDVILEVMAGVGGQEAMLFANDLFEMYKAYSMYKGWQTEVVGCDLNEQGGLRHGSLSVGGTNVYGRLKYEGGVHRVQRVPVTEKAGRMHTSTATVAVLPQPSDIDVDLKPKDLKIEVCRSSGKGGQHVNTTDSAVRVIHLPTGMTAECQTGRSQLLNKASALRILKTRIYQQQLDQQHSQQTRQRKIQVGSRGRSEKIRTYNYNQDRVTDHRIALSLHNLGSFLSGGDLLDGMVEAVGREGRRELLLEIINEFSDGSKK